MAKATGNRKTTPSARENSDENTFAKEFLVWVDDSSKVSDETIEVNKASVIQEAEQRGLRKSGEPKLAGKEVQDAHNVLLKYTLSVKPADETK